MLKYVMNFKSMNKWLWIGLSDYYVVFCKIVSRVHEWKEMGKKKWNQVGRVKIVKLNEQKYEEKYVRAFITKSV